MQEKKNEGEKESAGEIHEQRILNIECQPTREIVDLNKITK